MLLARKPVPNPVNNHPGEAKTYAHKRRIIFTALSSHLSGFKLLSAMDLWELEYADEPCTAMQSFAHEAVQQVDNLLDSRRLHLDLVRTTALPEAQLCESTKIDEFFQKFRPRYQTRDRAQLDHVLERFLVALLKQTGEKQATWLNVRVRRKANELRLNRQTRQSLANWISIKSQRLELPEAKLSELTQIGTLYYSSCCERLGTQKTTLLLARIARDIQTQDPEQYHVLTGQLLPELFANWN